MLRLRSNRIVAAAIAVLMASAPSAADSDLEEVRGCVAANTPRISSVQDVSIQVRERGEAGFRSKLKIFWRKLRDGERRILLRFDEPEDLRDAAVLVTMAAGKRAKVHIYLPGQGKPRSMHSRGELQGFLGRANLGVEELELLLDPLGRAGVELLPDRTLDERPVWVLDEHGEAGDGVRYQRKRTYIDREFCIPVRADFFAEGAREKTMLVELESLERVADSWIPRRLRFRDLALESDTELEVTKIEVDAAFSPALLTVKALPNSSR